MSETKDTQQHPDVEIAVKNFGPIAEANIDLRPLTVFVGPSNTGKTYFATLVYALHGISGGFAPFPLRDLASSPLDSVYYELRGMYFLLKHPEQKKAISELVKKSIVSGSPFKFSEMPEVLRAHLQSNLTNPEVVGTELSRCFDIKSISDLIRFTDSECYGMKVSLKVSGKSQEWWHLNMKATKSDIIVDGSINANLVLDPRDEPASNSTFSPEYFNEHFDEPTHRIPNSRKQYYLPASRSGILQSHRVMASSLMERAIRSDVEHSEIPTLSSVVVDFMRQLPLYEESKESNDVILAIADALESEVLAGKIIAKSLRSGYPEFFYQPQGTQEEIRLNQTSSMVSELAPLVLFLRGGINPGDTLIIEEPEAHLHPGAQADMAVILARLVRVGVKVIVTTHSDWLLQEIGNLIRAGELEKTDEEVSDLPTSLQKEQVGVWRFQKDGKVEEIAYDRIDGVEPMEYLDVAEDLYNRSARLQNRLEEAKGDSKRESE